MKPGGRPVHEPALGLWTMIAIAVGVVVVIAVVIDVSCYFMSGCGVTMCICVRLCDRQAPGDADDTAELKETNNKNNDVEATPVQPVLQAPADDRYFLASVADYPLGRIGSCLRPGMVWGPGPFIVNVFVAITMFSDQELHRVRITRRDDSTMFTMISDLVQYIVLVESIFVFIV